MTNRRYTKYTKELLEQAVKSSTTMREVLRKCGAPDMSGGTHAHVSRKVRAFGINTDHFVGFSNLGGKTHNKRSAEDVLVRHDDKTRAKSYMLTRALLEIGREYRCFECGIKQWKNKKIVFEIEHKDGDFQNDTPENLEFICPNCHSQTNTFCRKNRGDKKVKTVSEKRAKIARHPSNDAYWRTRDKPSQRKVARPSVGELNSLLKIMPMVKIGEKFGVSDNAVRKWVKRYGLDMPTLFGRSRNAPVVE